MTCVLAGCGGAADTGPTTPAPSVESLPVLTTLTVSLSVPTVQVGQNASARLVAIDEKGRPMTVGITEWTSNPRTVATVSPDGVIVTLAPGQATIMARVGTVQAQTTLVVTALPPGPAPVASVTVSPFSASLNVAQSLTLIAKAKDYAGNDLANREVSWSTSDATVATVSPLGVVTALAAGTAIIEATSELRRGAVSISVTAAPDTEIVVTIPIPASGVIVGDTMTVIATVQSLFPIVGAVASVGGQVTTLTYGEISGVGAKGEGPPPMGWSAILDLSSLPFGPYAMVITATDNRGHRGMSAVAFVRNPRVPGGSKSPSGGK